MHRADSAVSPVMFLFLFTGAFSHPYKVKHKSHFVCGAPRESILSGFLFFSFSSSVRAIFSSVNFFIFILISFSVPAYFSICLLFIILPVAITNPPKHPSETFTLATSPSLQTSPTIFEQQTTDKLLSSVHSIKAYVWPYKK